jgi:hypothetical protein
MSLFKETSIKEFKCHPQAYTQEQIMLNKLKEMPDYTETIIRHDWDRASNAITWYYAFQDDSNPEWADTVKSVIKQYDQPS